MISVGVIDSGFETSRGYGASFFKNGSIIFDEINHQCNHGSIIASLIQQTGLELYSAKVFHESLTTSPQQVAKALDYLIQKNVALIHMSLGMRSDHSMIRECCRTFLDNGGIIVASTPTQSIGEVYPAAYNGVIRVCADGRCEGNNISLLDKSPLRLGASPISSNSMVRGSSVSAARVSRVISSSLVQGISTKELLETLYMSGQL